MTAAHEPAPEPEEGESPQAYVLRVCHYLNEPHRRRLGGGTANHVSAAVDAMEGPSAAMMSAILGVVAAQPIEDMTDTDALRDAMATAEDIVSRIVAVLTDAKLWWTR